MLTDKEVAEVEAASAAVVGTQPDAFSWTRLSETPDPKAWIAQQAEAWNKEGMTYMRLTEDKDVLWLEFWRVRPEKEAPFVGWYTSAHPTPAESR